MLVKKTAWGVVVARKSLNGDLELPPVAAPGLRSRSLHVCTMGGVEAAHTERRLCSCRLMQWLIEAEPLYSSTTGFEIQHCTWGAMSVPSLSPCINLSFYLPFSDSPPSHSEFLYFWRYVPANSPWHDMPQVGIIASAASGAHLRCCFSVFLEIKQGRMWKFPVEKQEYFQSFWRYRYLMPAGWSRAQIPPFIYL